jgi:RND family efflux transporter MFP subunit
MITSVLDPGARRRPHRSHNRFRSCLAAGLLGTAAAAASATGGYAANFDCVMNPFLTVKVGSPVTSVLSVVRVDRGDMVKKGEPLANIEASVEQAAVATNEARAASIAEIESKKAVLELKNSELKRKLDLQSRGVGYGSVRDAEMAQADANVAKQDVALAELTHQLAQLELDRARAQLEQRTIRAPFDGIVTERALGPGEFVRMDANIVTLARIDPLNVEAYLPVRYYGSLKVGDVGVVHPDEPVGGEYEAKVSIVDQVFDAASGTFGVRLTLPNPGNRLPGGQRCHVTFNFPEQAPPKFEALTRPGVSRSVNVDPPARKTD